MDTNPNNGSQFDTTLFFTNEIAVNKNLTSEEYNNFGFGNLNNTNTNSYKYQQTQAVQFSANADTVWTASDPKIINLEAALKLSLKLTNANAEQSVKLVLKSDLLRA